MSVRKTVVVARLMWAVPLILLALGIYQAGVSSELRHTLEAGEPAQAAVTRYHRVDRKDVTQAELDLRVRLADGSILEKKNLALPYSLSFLVEEDSLAVRVLRGAPEEVVIEAIAATQSRIAALNAAMCLLGFVLSALGVGLWNRYLKRHGDPGEVPAPRVTG